MLAGVETMLRHRDILQGVKFTWYTDHKGLIHLLEQKNLSGRQARWMEKIAEFDFDVVYVPGTENILSDSLSHLYSYDEPGTVRAHSEYTYHDVIDNDVLGTHLISMPVLVGLEGESAGVVPPDVVSALNAGSSRPKPRRGHKVVALAETGRPETAKEFAARTRAHFVLKGPVERKEGESTQSTLPTQQKLTICLPGRKPWSDNADLPCLEVPLDGLVPEKIPNLEELLDQEISNILQSIEALSRQTGLQSLVELINGGREPIDLLKELKGRYSEDPLFKNVLEKPKEFRNFELIDDIL